MWEQEKHGAFVDEAYMIPKNSKAFTAIRTQGRSKRVPVIACTQRPSWLNPFLMSEAGYHQVFHLQKPEDVKTIKEWVPGLRPTKKNFHSQYYDVKRDELTLCAPVPDEDEILDRFDRKMPHRTARLFKGLFENAPASKGKPKLA